MFKVIDTDKNVEMSAKYELGQEVVITSFQGYRKGVVTGIIGSTNEKGTVIYYNVELYVGKHAAPKVKKVLEPYVYGNVKEALQALEEQSEKQDFEDAEEEEAAEGKKKASKKSTK